MHAPEEQSSGPKIPPDVSNNSSSELESSGAGARAKRTPEMLVSDALDHMLEMGQNVKSRVSKAREFADSIPGDLGKEISELRNWHTTQTEENDYESISGESPDSSIARSANSSELPPGHQSLWQELEAEKVDRYTAEHKRDVATEERKSMQVKIQSLEARIKSVEHEKDVENLAKQNMIDELLQQIDKLQQENAALEKENQ